MFKGIIVPVAAITKIEYISNTANKFYLPLAVFCFTFLFLAMVQVKISHPIILLERFVKGAGWVEISVIALYAAFVGYKMQDPPEVPKWRRITWIVFSVVFFGQLLIGIFGAERFLMTGKLHLPIPFMIISGPIYRGQLSVMTILFLSTILLVGPAWCSQLCYFGAFDSIASTKKSQKGVIKNKKSIKAAILFLIIAATLVLRWFNVSILSATLIATAFGVVGVGVMILYSGRKGKMVHCILYCPVGTLVNIIKPVNPFRIRIESSCTMCLKCTSFCKYDALNIQDLRNKKPGFTCTYCGDCLAACRDNSINYHFFNLKPETSRLLYLMLTISLHAIFLATARI